MFQNKMTTVYTDWLKILILYFTISKFKQKRPQKSASPCIKFRVSSTNFIVKREYYEYYGQLKTFL